jgi:hypothetical protein
MQDTQTSDEPQPQSGLTTKEVDSSMVRSGDVVVLSDGGKTVAYVVLGFTKWHVNLTTKKNYDYCMRTYGEYSGIVCGYASFPKKSTGVQMGFWSMLQTVNGKQYNSGR